MLVYLIEYVYLSYIYLLVKCIMLYIINKV